MFIFVLAKKVLKKKENRSQSKIFVWRRKISWIILREFSKQFQYVSNIKIRSLHKHYLCTWNKNFLPKRIFKRWRKLWIESIRKRRMSGTVQRPSQMKRDYYNETYCNFDKICDIYTFSPSQPPLTQTSIRIRFSSSYWKPQRGRPWPR